MLLRYVGSRTVMLVPTNRAQGFWEKLGYAPAVMDASIPQVLQLLLVLKGGNKMLGKTI
jgi:hypothetical protein